MQHKQQQQQEEGGKQQMENSIKLNKDVSFLVVVAVAVFAASLLNWELNYIFNKLIGRMQMQLSVTPTFPHPLGMLSSAQSSNN